MTKLSEVLSHLYPSGTPGKDWLLSANDDGTISILEWNKALGPEPTQSQIDAVTQADIDAAVLAKLRAAAKQFHADLRAENLALRATVKLVVDELNILRQWITDYKAQVAASTSLGNLQTRVASLPNTPQRTYAQAKSAIESLIDRE